MTSENTKKDKVEAKAIAKAFLNYLSEKGSSLLLPEIVNELKKEIEKMKKNVVISTPIVLTADQKKSAVKLAHKLIGSSDVEIKYISDKTILDGIRVEYGDKVWDYTLASLLERVNK